MLAEIADFEGAPKLYFASEQKEEDTLRFCIGMEYIAGKSLFDLTQEKTIHFDWSKIGERLVKSLRRLHDHYGISHGDLSPKNVLIRSVDHRAILIDWEFAEKIADQNLSSYESYRGTQGFNSLDGTSGLILKDQEALNACLKYCGVLDHLPVETKAFSGFFSKWFKGKK